MVFRAALGLLLSGMLATALWAQGAQVTFGGMKQDTNAPIEVSADSLSVNQSTGSAVYTGNVVIGQGDMRLAAQRVTVVYSSDNSAVERLEATGGVTMVSGAEAAEAERADYNVQSGNVVLSGNVLLTQGNNALTAERMTVDLNSGTAQMTGRVRTVLGNGSQ